jgi:hypothetical protein
VELDNHTDEPRFGRDRIIQRHKLGRVCSGKVEFSPATFARGRAIFTRAEMRHNFAIWAVTNNTANGAPRHLYYCLRCKQAFSVDDRSGYVTPLDSQGNTLQGGEAVKRVDTFSYGPCPAFSKLVRQRLTSKIIPIHFAPARLTGLTSLGFRTWKAVVAHWHRLRMADRTSQNVRSLPK